MIDKVSRTVRVVRTATTILSFWLLLLLMLLLLVFGVDDFTSKGKISSKGMYWQAK
jgi:hypothetical protein